MFSNGNYCATRETELYYLQSRYYNPEWGRFINADIFVSTGQGMLGNNMFAYCGNNPVIFSDPSGCLYFLTLDMETHGFLSSTLQHYTGGGGSIATSKSASCQVILKEIDFFNNTSEQIVLESSTIAFYKGTPVFRINGSRSGSFGIIFLTHETNQRSNASDVIRHEYGHTKQLAHLGFVKYALCIGLPSWLEWGTCKSYYDRPWEVTADIFGGVQSRAPTQSVAEAGFEYLYCSELFGIIAWLTID